MADRILSSKILGTYALAMMAVVAITDLRGLPMMASYGLSSVFFYSIAALLFLIPSGLVCAELATHLPQAGGMYTWIRHSFGDKIGFLAIWLEWLNNIVSYPASLSFVAVTLAYLFDKHLAEHKSYIFTTAFVILWTTTWFTSRGIKASSLLCNLGALVGVIIPALLIGGMGFLWIFSGKPLQIDLSWHQLLPNLHQINIAFFAGTLLGYAGMQVIAFHSPNVNNPEKNYPRAIWLAMTIIFMVTVAGSLAIAVVVPHDQLNLVSGLIDSFNRFFIAFHMTWATPILILFILLSAFATLSTWFLGPARGLSVAAQNGFLPRIFARTNDKQVPVNILILQGTIASIFCAVFLYMPDISSGFWLLLNLSSQSTLIMYSLIFASAIKRRYLTSTSVNKKAYKIPGGNIIMWLVSGLGISSCVIALAASIIPPKMINAGGVWHYEMILLLSNFTFLSIPFGIYYLTRRDRATLLLAG
jgi:amino acid transporter